MIRSPDHSIFHEIKIANNAFLNFDLMIDLLVTRTIMRSKPKKALLDNFDLVKNAAIRRLNQLLGILTS
jgi:hypothetical protein